MLGLAAALDKVQAIVAQDGGGAAFRIAKRHAERILQHDLRIERAAGHIVKQHIGVERHALLLEGKRSKRFAVRGQISRYDIVFRGLVFEYLLARGVVDRDRGAVALFVGHKRKAAVLTDAAGDDGGVEAQLGHRRGGIGQHRLHAAAVIDQHIVVAGLHHRGGISQRVFHRGHAAGARQKQGIVICIGDARFKQRGIRKGAVFIVDGCDIALMLLEARHRIFYKAGNGSGREQAVVGEQE